MSGKQNAVLWIGLILVGLNLVMRWSQIKDVIFSGSAGPSGTTTEPSSNSGGNSIQVPIDPFIGPASPKITVPLPNL